MPELPEVENFKLYFNKKCCNKTILDIECYEKRLIKRISFSDFVKKLKGKKFTKAERRGKVLIITADDLKQKLIIHFGMTGGLHCVKSDVPKIGEDRFSRVIFKFKNGYEMRWLNRRKLGKIWLVESIKEVDLLKKMGKEPLEMSKNEFLEALNNCSGKIKSVLMNQEIIAGIGNIYSDEILFQSRITPFRKIQDLTLREKDALYKNMKKVLKKAIELAKDTYYYGQPIEFPKTWIIPFRHKGICPNNKNHKLKRVSIAGRNSYYCPVCQK